MADAKPRKAPKRRPVYVIMQILDDSGNPVDFDKEKVHMVVGSQDTGAVLDALEQNAHAFSKKVELGT